MVLLFYQGINGVQNVEEIDIFQFDTYEDFRDHVQTLVYGLDGNGVNGNVINANGNNAAAGPVNANGNNAAAGPVNANGYNANADAAHANGHNADAAHANGHNAAHFQEIVQALAQEFGEIQMTYVDNMDDEWPLDEHSGWLDVTLYSLEFHVQLV